MAKQNKGRKFFATTATAALVASAIVPVASAAELNDFNQVPTWAKDAVQFLVDSGSVQGDNNGNFKPFNNLSRAQAAEILTKQLGLDTAGSENFSDVASADWFYNAVVATSNAGIFQGNDKGQFQPNKELTRQEAAVVIVNAFGLEGSTSLNSFADAAKVPTWAKAQFEAAVANGVINGKGALLAPQDTISNAEFATMIFRAVEAASVVPGVESVTAINNTTVEVDFEEAVDNVDALKFAIEGLTVTNAVVKQTDSTVVVLTTSAQEGGKEYTVTEGGNALGKFVGVSAVLPTDIEVTTKSVQGTIGEEVTVSANVEVKEGQSAAGIPVTFNITSDHKNNKTIEVEVLTDEDGVAEYSYTRFYKATDDVVAYSTSKSSINDNAVVYWAESLTVEEVDEEDTLANGSKKVYKIKSSGLANNYVQIAFKENVNVDPDELVRSVNITDAEVYEKDGSVWVEVDDEAKKYPYQVKTGGVQTAVVKLDSNGEATFTVTGSNATVTPVVYYEETRWNNDDSEFVFGNGKLDATELQATASAVKFELAHTLQLDVKAEGVQRAAAETDRGEGGREYTVTIKDEKGKVAPAGYTAYVTFEKGSLSPDADVYIDGELAEVGGIYEIEVTGKEGKATFKLTGEKDAFATPTVYLENGKDSEELDSEDLQVKGEKTFFVDAVVKEAVLTVTNEAGTEVENLVAGEIAVFTYESVDQNGFPYYKGDGDYEVSFEISTTFGDLSNIEVNGKALPNSGKTATVKVTAEEGVASIELTSDLPTDVKVRASASKDSLPGKTATVGFSKYVTGSVTGYVLASGTDTGSKDELTLVDANGKEHLYNYTGATFKDDRGRDLTKADFEDILDAVTTTNSVNITVVKFGDNYTFTVKESVTIPTLTGLTAQDDQDADKGEYSGNITFTATSGTDNVNVYLDGVLFDTVNGTGTSQTVAVSGNIEGNADIKVEVIAGSLIISDTISVIDNTSATDSQTEKDLALGEINTAASTQNWVGVTLSTFTDAGVEFLEGYTVTAADFGALKTRLENEIALGGELTIEELQEVVDNELAEEYTVFEANSEIAAAKTAIGTTHEFASTANLTEDNSAALKTALDTKVNNADITLVVTKVSDTSYSVVISHVDGGTDQTVTVTVSKAAA